MGQDVAAHVHHADVVGAEGVGGALDLTGEVFDALVGVEQRELRRQVTGEPGQGGATGRDRLRVGGDDRHRQGAVFEAGEVVSGEGAGQGIHARALPAVGEYDGVGCGATARVDEGGTDRVTAATRRDEQVGHEDARAVRMPEMPIGVPMCLRARRFPACRAS